MPEVSGGLIQSHFTAPGSLLLQTARAGTGAALRNSGRLFALAGNFWQVGEQLFVGDEKNTGNNEVKSDGKQLSGRAEPSL